MSKRAELSTGEALVGLLEAHGVDTIFGEYGLCVGSWYWIRPRLVAGRLVRLFSVDQLAVG